MLLGIFSVFIFFVIVVQYFFIQYFITYFAKLLINRTVFVIYSYLLLRVFKTYYTSFNAIYYTISRKSVIRLQHFFFEFTNSVESTGYSSISNSRFHSNRMDLLLHLELLFVQLYRLDKFVSPFSPFRLSFTSLSPLFQSPQVNCRQR